MSTVSMQEVVSYGLSLGAYFLGVVLVSGVAFALGGVLMAGDGSLLNAVLSFVGFGFQLLASVVFLIGVAGALYKVIADGVRTGSMDLS